MDGVLDRETHCGPERPIVKQRVRNSCPTSEDGEVPRVGWLKDIRSLQEEGEPLVTLYWILGDNVNRPDPFFCQLLLFLGLLKTVWLKFGISISNILKKNIKKKNVRHPSDVKSTSSYVSKKKFFYLSNSDSNITRIPVPYNYCLRPTLLNLRDIDFREYWIIEFIKWLWPRSVAVETWCRTIHSVIIFGGNWRGTVSLNFLFLY